MTLQPLIDAMRQALAKDPHNAPLWAHLGDLLAQAGSRKEAADAFRRALELVPGMPGLVHKWIPLLRETGQHAEALLRLEALLAQRDDPQLRLELARVQLARGARAEAIEQYRAAQRADRSVSDAELETLARDVADAAPGAQESPREPARAAVREGPLDQAAWASLFDWGGLRVTLDDVVGLEDVKKQIRLRVLAPRKNQELYKAFARKGGGGLLLYGPPGCGKTYLARATAGELAANFVCVGIHDVLDKYWGESEKLVHQLFVEARRKAPTVLFFDEFDALGASRGRTDSQFWRTIVNQFLQEMDGFASQNDDVLVIGATNQPWNVDPAFRRPGRFDRLLFVPPPDLPAREELLRRHSAQVPGGAALDLRGIARAAETFTGADLKALCERASEEALERSLESGKVHEVTRADFEREHKRMQSSAVEWLATARNHARYANEAGLYDEIIAYLKKVKAW